MRRFAAAIGIVLVAVGAPRAEESRLAPLEQWLAMVRSHEPGVVDQPVQTLAGWSNREIASVWLLSQTLLNLARCAADRAMGLCHPAVTVTGVDGRKQRVDYTKHETIRLRELATEIRLRHEYNDILKRGAILHADIVMFADLRGERHVDPPPVPSPFTGRRSGEQSRFLPVPERVIMKTQDGRQDSVTDAAPHLELAYGLLDLVTDPSGEVAPAGDATVRAWYRATIAYFQATALYDQAHIQRALTLFPDDPDVLFQAGCLHESLAAPRVQAVLRSTTLPAGVITEVRSDRSEWEIAERYFRRAVAMRPDFAEARLRLGRALGMLGRHADAAAELRGLPDTWDHVANRYFAAMFRGAEEEALGRVDEARTAYTNARDTFPLAQSPAIALSHLARQSGDRVAALSGIQPVLNLPPEEVNRRDPYWVYHRLPGRDLDRLLDGLYTPFRHARR